MVLLATLLYCLELLEWVSSPSGALIAALILGWGVGWGSSMEPGVALTSMLLMGLLFYFEEAAP